MISVLYALLYPSLSLSQISCLLLKWAQAPVAAAPWTEVPGHPYPLPLPPDLTSLSFPLPSHHIPSLDLSCIYFMFITTGPRIATVSVDGLCSQINPSYISWILFFLNVPFRDSYPFSKVIRCINCTIGVGTRGRRAMPPHFLFIHLFIYFYFIHKIADESPNYGQSHSAKTAIDYN